MEKLSNDFFEELKELMLMIEELKNQTLTTGTTEKTITRQLGVVQYLYMRDMYKEEK